ncbi:MAG: hypothetical protein IT317_21750 [Anaerolineales bacterium]|nr:hypothetical protein [Anaerolineales bacterium]
MPQKPSHRPPRYHTFLLGLWNEAGSAPAWRCSLENPHTGERWGFSTMEELAAFLTAWTQQRSDPNGRAAPPAEAAQ